ncbi:MAG: hypothetical protein CME06_05535 [Gemmatimonadetes bacterium]|nr:hypothetical protein [Gemmatimonadota bacterium]
MDVALVEDLTIAANVNEWQTLFLDAYVPNGTFMVYVQLEAEYDSSTLSDAFFLEARQQGEAQ